MEGIKFVKIAVGVILVFLLGTFLKLAQPILIPFFMALLLSFAITPLLDFLVRRKVPKAAAVAGILILTFIILYLVGVLFYSSGKSLVSELPSYNDMVKSFLGGVDRTFHNEKLNVDISEWLNGLNVEKLGSVILSALGPFLNFLTGLLLVFIFMIFILAGRGRLERKIVQAFSPEQANAVSLVVQKIDRQTQRYLAYKTLISLAVGILTTVILVLFHLPFAFVFGVLTFILNFIPNLGSVIAGILPVIMAVFFFGTLGPAIWILVLLTIVHMVMGNVVEPRLQGIGLGLSPLLVLFSLFFWSWLWGIPGMILAVPILAVVKIIFSNVPSLKFLEALME